MKAEPQLTAIEVEKLFCLALLQRYDNQISLEQVNQVLKKYLWLKDNAEVVLKPLEEQ